jgi:hypothetical protein
MTHQSPTSPSQLIIVIITNHDKFNFVSDIGQNDTAIYFETATWQNSNQLCYSYLTEPQSKLPTKGCNTTIHFVTAIGRTEVKQLIATQQSAMSQLSGRTELIVADN